MQRLSNLTTIFLPSLAGGGAERVMVTLANGIAARGYRVDLVLAKAVGSYLADVAPAVHIIDLNVLPVINIHYRPCTDGGLTDQAQALQIVGDLHV